MISGSLNLWNPPGHTGPVMGLLSFQRGLPSLLSWAASFSKIRAMSYHSSQHYVPEDLNNQCLTLILLTWRIWWAPNNANRWQVGFNLVSKGLRGLFMSYVFDVSKSPGIVCHRWHIWCVVNPGSVLMNWLSSEIKFIVPCLFSCLLMLSVLKHFDS
jgi:hypothetical protein